jgi:hypothetical protein
MNFANTTKKERIDEPEASPLWVSERAKHERDSQQALESIGQRSNRSLEVANHIFSELFDVSPEESCSSSKADQLFRSVKERPQNSVRSLSRLYSLTNEDSP